MVYAINLLVGTTTYNNGKYRSISRLNKLNLYPLKSFINNSMNRLCLISVLYRTCQPSMNQLSRVYLIFVVEVQGHLLLRKNVRVFVLLISFSRKVKQGLITNKQAGHNNHDTIIFVCQILGQRLRFLTW